MSHSRTIPDPARIREAVDLPKMEAAHVVTVGAGGAESLMEDLVRCGLGRVTALDLDHVSETNVYSQGYTCDDVGLTKVQALGNRLTAINPALRYEGLVHDFLALEEQEIGQIVAGADLLLMMTDNFHAQARGNIVGLKYTIPTISAIVYPRGRCAEVTWNLAGVTPACIRCVTAGRYRAYAAGFSNEGGSNGATVFSAHLLNSVLGFLSLGILLRGTSCGFGGMMERLGSRNFMQIRMDPDFTIGENDVFGKFLGKRDSIFSFDSIWLRPDDPPVYEVCPDCHSTGDLRESAKYIGSTMPVIV